MSQLPAFSMVADAYDATFSDTAVGRLQRQMVWSFLEKSVVGTPRVLELNCGTGTDAIWMAKRGWEVLATDISAEMLRVTNAKITAAGLESKVKTRVCPFGAIKDLNEGTFDLVFSNFGGLNCLPPDALQQLWHDAQTLLKPGGQIIVVVMGRFCAWESLYFLLKGKPRTAFRRLRRNAVAARLDADTTVDTWYYSPNELCAGLRQARGRVPKTEVQGIGVWLPPSYLDPFFSKWPKLLRCLYFLERKSRSSWYARVADHYLVQAF